MLEFSRDKMIYTLVKYIDEKQDDIKQLKISLNKLIDKLATLRMLKNEKYSKDIQYIEKAINSLSYVINNILKRDLNSAKEKLEEYRNMSEEEFKIEYKKLLGFDNCLDNQK